MQTSSPHAAARSTWGAVALVAGLWHAGCAVCDAHGECAGDTLCIEGACVDAPAASATVLLPSGPVGDTFEVALELRFRGGEAIVSLERSVDAPGEPCLPLPPLTQRVEGDVDDLVTRVIVIPGVPSLGRSFTLVARVEVNGRTIFVPIPVEGPVPEGVGGITLVTPRRRDIDAIGDALLDVEVQARGITRAWIEPLLPSTAPSSPRAFLTTTGDRHTGRVPTIRGPQLLWVEATNGEAAALCGHTLVGGPAEVASDVLEVLLFSRSVTGEEQLVELSTRITDDGTVGFCEGRSGSSDTCRARVRASTGPESIDGLLVGVDHGVVELAAVPRIVSGPVEVQVRVARGERHLGHFGPITLQPALGEAWVAGRIVIDDAGQLQVSPDADPPTPGLPW